MPYPETNSKHPCQAIEVNNGQIPRPINYDTSVPLRFIYISLSNYFRLSSKELNTSNNLGLWKKTSSKGCFGKGRVSLQCRFIWLKAKQWPDNLIQIWNHIRGFWVSNCFHPTGPALSGCGKKLSPLQHRYGQKISLESMDLFDWQGYRPVLHRHLCFS